MRTSAAACLALPAALATASCSGRQPEPFAADTAVVLFVCEHGSAKSLVAASHFNRLAAEQNIPIRAIARGLDPDEAVSEGVRAGLQLDGIDLGVTRPRALTAADLDTALVVVSFAGPLKLRLRERPLLLWDSIPPVSAGYETARTAIVGRLRGLIRALHPQGAPHESD